MAVYLLKDLLDRLSEIAEDGYHSVEISEIESEDDLPACLSFCVYTTEDSSIEYDQIEELPPEGREGSVTFDDICHEANFSYNEIYVLYESVVNALEYYKDNLNNKSIPNNVKNDIKDSEIAARNLQAKLRKIVNSFSGK